MRGLEVTMLVVGMGRGVGECRVLLLNVAL